MSFLQLTNSSPPDTLPQYTLKQKVFRATQPVLYWSGAASLFARLRPSSVATILMYHSVPTPETSRWIDPYNSIPAATFERQMQFLAKHRHVISLDDLVSALRQGNPLPRGTVAITFDDGYLDNFEVAAPILARYQLPATLYLTTAAIDQGKPQWIDALYSAFTYRSKQHLSLKEYGLSNWQLRNPLDLRRAYLETTQRLLVVTVTEREALLAEVQSQLVPNRYPPRLTLTWQEVRQLRKRFPNFEIGAHTVNHLDLSTHPQSAAWEITTALDRIEEETGYRPRHFAYPYNRYNAAAQAAVKAARLETAVATSADPVVRMSESPLVRSQPDLYALPRLEASHSMTLLRLRTGGAFPDLSKQLFGRAWTAAH